MILKRFISRTEMAAIPFCCYMPVIPQALPPLSDCAHTHCSSRTNSHPDDPRSYLVYVNNGLDVLKRITRITFKYLCQKNNVIQHEDDIKLIILSQ